jgi:hypothetical protein
MKVLQIDQQKNLTQYEGIANKLVKKFLKYEGITNKQINTKYKEGITNRLAIKTFKQ